MTHLYSIGLGGTIRPRRPDDSGPDSTAIAWAADTILSVGSDETVSSISRGDSLFLDLAGCVVTPLPADPGRADQLIEAAIRVGGSGVDLGQQLVELGQLEADAYLEAGSHADLAFWRAPASTGGPVPPPRLVAVVRDGAFIEGDEHRGPFHEPERS